MKHEFDMTELGMMKYFLEVMQKSEGIHSQKKYACQMQNGNSVENPIVPGSKLSKGAMVDATVHKHLIGTRHHVCSLC